MSSPPRRPIRKPLSHVGRGEEQRPGTRAFRGDPAWEPLLARAFLPPVTFDERQATHGFHAWPARLHPWIARTLIARAPAGLAIADPFMGGGTTPLEALIAGRLAVGNDLNPIGFEVAWTRTRTGAPALVGRAKELARAAESKRDDPVDPAFALAVGDWFDAVALREVFALRSALINRSNDEISRILRAVLSSILVKVSKQVSDSIVKVDRDAPKRSPHGQVFRWFVGRAAELESQLADLARAVPANAPTPRLILGDARNPPTDLPPLGAIITSPPYPGVYDYLHHHLVRCVVLGFDAGLAAAAEIGARRVHEREGRDVADSRYVDAMADVFRAWSATLAPGGFWALVVGDGQLGASVIPALPLITDAAARQGLRVSATLSEARPTFGPGRQRGPTKAEHLVIIEAA